MGWTSFLGGIAKGFAEGYIEERGIKGTVEDVTNLAKSIFSSNDDDSLSEFLSEYDSLIDDERYMDAYDYVNEIYDGETKDNVYYYLCAHSTNLAAINEENIKEGLQLIENAITYINKAWGKTEIGTDFYKDIKKLKETISENQKILKQNLKMLENWETILKKIDQLCVIDKDFIQAEKLLVNHYREYENGELDFSYWRELVNIHYLKHLESKTEEENESSYRVFLRDIDQAYSFIDDNAELAAEISDWRNWDKHTIELKQKGIDSVSNPNHEREISSNESEYVDELKSCLEDDGVISDRERRLLNKLRQSLGISEARAAELEEQLKNTPLSHDEQEYADELKTFLEDDGAISERERRLLDRLRKSLGISEERALKIEKIIKRK